jgi:hypothetical protein
MHTHSTYHAWARARAPPRVLYFRIEREFNFGFSKFIVHFAAGGVWYKIPVGGVHEANKFRVNFPPESLRFNYMYFSKTQIIFLIVLITSSTKYVHLPSTCDIAIYIYIYAAHIIFVPFKLYTTSNNIYSDSTIRTQLLHNYHCIYVLVHTSTVARPHTNLNHGHHNKLY